MRVKTTNHGLIKGFIHQSIMVFGRLDEQGSDDRCGDFLRGFWQVAAGPLAKRTAAKNHLMAAFMGHYRRSRKVSRIGISRRVLDTNPTRKRGEVQLRASLARRVGMNA